MKRLFCAFLALSLAALCAGCAGKQTDEGVTWATPSVIADEGVTAPTDAEGYSLFVKPFEAQILDLLREDISTDTMKFTYDGDGRILSCEYSADGQAIRVEYAYLADGGIQIRADCAGSPAARSVYYPTGGFLPEYGFSAYDGYYFYGYTFSAMK